MVPKPRVRVLFILLKKKKMKKKKKKSFLKYIMYEGTCEYIGIEKC